MVRTFLLAVACVACLAGRTEGAAVSESARRIPVAYQVDVVVVGGSSGAVSAAVAAAESGAKVFLAAPRPYLGEDICATNRLWLEKDEKPASPLAVLIYSDRPTPAIHPKGLPFTYETSIKSADRHKDTNPPSRLTDGVLGPVESQSVQYDGDVTITMDLGVTKMVEKAQIVVFHRAGDFDPQSASARISDDRASWKDSGSVQIVFDPSGTSTVVVPIKSSGRYVALEIKRRPETTRILLGEIVLVGPMPAERKTELADTVRPPVRPMHVKKTLDEALLAAKVDYLFGCYVTDVLRDDQGQLAGIVMANRAGRQAVLAKTIIDATTRATVARLAGAAFTPYPAGKQTFQWIVIGPEPGDKPTTRPTPKDARIVAARQVAIGYGDGFAGYPLTEYTLEIPMADDSFASFARAEQIARDLTCNEDWEANTEALFQIPPDQIRSRRPAESQWTDAGSSDLAALRPAGVERLYVLGGCADVPREVAAKLLRPAMLIEVGAEVGKAAAREAKTAAIAGPAAVKGSKGAVAVGGDVKELLANVRPTIKDAPAVASDQRSLPILGTYDVVVVGGGTGGAPAGISASRKGARTLVLEYLHGLGGVGTMGLISSYYWGYRGGFTAEIPGGARWRPLDKAEWYRQELRRNKADIWFGVLGCGAFVEAGVVKGVVVATPHGRGVVLAKVVIDSTGSSDTAAAAGAATMDTGADEMALQGTGLPYVKLNPSYTNTDFTIVDETDMLDTWHVLVYAKNKYPAAFDLGQLIDTRERRRIVGDFVMTLPDQINLRTYPDTISIAYSNFDTHGYTVDPYLLIEHPEKKGITVNIPYRCLLPRGLEGILVTGLGISVHRDAVPLTRMQPDIQNQGYAAGMIAAHAARNNLALRSVDLPTIQKELVSIGIIPEKALTERDSYPLPADKIAEAVASARTGHGMSVIVTHPQQSLPLVKKAYTEAADAKDKLFYARVLAVMGDATGLEPLLAALESATWDKGWNYTGMGQFGSSLSEVDTLIVAIGRTRDRRALPAILTKLRQLDAASAFSHHRACALALESIGDPSAAPALADVLKKPGIAGHVHLTVEDAKSRSGANPNDNSTRATSIRELTLARALYRCGDHQGLGRTTLEQYTRDLRGHLARHAQAVLEQK